MRVVSAYKGRMRVLSLHQPWASAVALGLKRVETRGRRTRYRGLLAIHAAAKWTWEERGALANLLAWREVRRAFFGEAGVWSPKPRAALADEWRPPLGCVVAVAEVVGCEEMTPELVRGQPPLEVALGNWRPGRFAIYLREVRRLPQPIPLKGRQSMFVATPELERAVLAQAVAC